MFISLGGAIGPNAGGHDAVVRALGAGRGAAGAEARVETPPAAKAPEMSIPDPELRPTPRTPVKVDKPVDKASSRKPTTGAEVKTGDARADTGAAPIPFGGLSTGGGGTGGVQVNVGDFCCPEYIATMNQLITQNWNRNQVSAGKTIMKFIIQRNGMLTAIEVDQSSGNPVLDLESRRALLTTTTAATAAGRVHPADAHRVPFIRVHALMTSTRFLTAAFSVCAAVLLVAQAPAPQAPQPPAAPSPAAQQPDEISTAIVGAPGLPPKMAVPDFIPLSNDRRLSPPRRPSARCSGTT